MRVKLVEATANDAAAVVKIRNDAADGLTAQFGNGPWSWQATEKGVRQQLKSGSVFLALKNAEPMATLVLSRKKPWAHDRKYFTPCETPRFLVSMAVAPQQQRSGIGRACLEALRKTAAASGCHAICLDAYDHAAGAGEFYRKCGYTEVGRVSYRGTPLIYFELLL